MHPLFFLSFLIYTAFTLVGVYSTSIYALSPVLFVFVAIPLIDLLLGLNKRNPTAAEEFQWRSSQVWSPALYLYIFTHFLVLLLALHHVSEISSFSGLLFMSLIVGLYTGGLGITVAHELCHKKEKIHRWSAELLLASVWYTHFAVEHVRGHHFLVSTPEDPASARRNENIYAFLYRSLIGSFLHALKLDQKAVIRGVLISLALSALVSFWGWQALVFFILQAVVAFVLLEIVNYVEHYGLYRKPLQNGRYEKVLPLHSWNSAHIFSNLILFNLQRHSDHHAQASLPYTLLKNQESAPQLPAGYPSMVLIALVPALWFKVMNPRVEHWQKNLN
jgi:alkane 1-monooxygenase